MNYNKYYIMDLYIVKCSEIWDTINENSDGINIYDYLRECATPQTTNGEISSN